MKTSTKIFGLLMASSLLACSSGGGGGGNKGDLGNVGEKTFNKEECPSFETGRYVTPQKGPNGETYSISLEMVESQGQLTLKDTSTDYLIDGHVHKLKGEGDQTADYVGSCSKGVMKVEIAFQGNPIGYMTWEKVGPNSVRRFAKWDFQGEKNTEDGTYVK